MGTLLSITLTWGICALPMFGSAMGALLTERTKNQGVMNITALIGFGVGIWRAITLIQYIPVPSI